MNWFTFVPYLHQYEIYVMQFCMVDWDYEELFVSHYVFYLFPCCMIVNVQYEQKEYLPQFIYSNNWMYFLYYISQEVLAQCAFPTQFAVNNCATSRLSPFSLFRSTLEVYHDFVGPWICEQQGLNSLIWFCLMKGIRYQFDTTVSQHYSITYLIFSLCLTW